MSNIIPDSHKDLLEKPLITTMVTVMADGQPQATVVWRHYDGNHILVSTTRGRQKERNLRDNPKTTLMTIDPQNPYRYIEIRGIVEEVTEEGGIDLINTLAQNYTGKSTYYGGVAPAERATTETRVVLKIKPQKVVTIG